MNCLKTRFHKLEFYTDQRFYHFIGTNTLYNYYNQSNRIVNKPNTNNFEEILKQRRENMAIKSTKEYIDFFTNLNMGENVPLLSFVNNEKMVLKQKLEHKDLEKDPIKKGIEILEQIIKEINEMGEKAVLKKYHTDNKRKSFG